MNRISFLASLCKGSRIVCDIGCDHGYVLIEAIKQFGVERGIACDIACGPLQAAGEHIALCGLKDSIFLVLSDGFQNVTQDFDTAVLAGMGGMLISDILVAGKEKIKGKRLVLQANHDRAQVRKILVNLGFEIVEEYAFYDHGKYYEIMVAEPGRAKYLPIDYTYGPLLRREKNTAFRQYYRKRYEDVSQVVSRIKDEKQRLAKLTELKEIEYILGGISMEKEYIENTKNYYEAYFIDEQARPTILISPGGGYAYTSPRESVPVARVFNKFGYHAVVVHYRETAEEAYPMPAKYLACVFRRLQKDTRVKKIIGLGFSAGGHNLLEVCLHPAEYNIAPLDLLMLGYPVVTADERYWHRGSFVNLLKDNFDNSRLRSRLSLETQVTATAPDLFLWGTYTDESVDVMNSLLLIEAYKRNRCNAEYHMFPMGGHGLSVCTAESAEGNPEKISPYIGSWTELAGKWITEKLKKIK